jgi:hypothetical protein
MLIWLEPVSEPVACIQWAGVNVDEVIEFTGGEFSIEVLENGAALGILNGEQVDVEKFIVFEHGKYTAHSRSYIEQNYRIL